MYGGKDRTNAVIDHIDGFSGKFGNVGVKVETLFESFGHFVSPCVV
jgi:hypothetical protein